MGTIAYTPEHYWSKQSLSPCSPTISWLITSPMTIHKIGCGSTAFQGRGSEVVGSILHVQRTNLGYPARAVVVVSRNYARYDSWDENTGCCLVQFGFWIPLRRDHSWNPTDSSPRRLTALQALPCTVHDTFQPGPTERPRNRASDHGKCGGVGLHMHGQGTHAMLAVVYGNGLLF